MQNQTNPAPLGSSMAKVSLPTKIKIAAWWMIAFGIMIILLGIKEILEPSGIPLIGRFMVMLFVLLPFLLSIYGGTFLLKRRKWAYIFSVIVTIIIIIFSFFNLEEHLIWYLSFFSNIFILFLLLLDCKNFWKIAT